MHIIALQEARKREHPFSNQIWATLRCTTHNAQCTMYNAQCIMYNALCTMHNARFTMHNTQTMHGGLRPPASIIHNASCMTTKCPTHNSHCAIRNAHYCLARNDARNDAWRPPAAHHYPVQYALHNTQRTMHSAQYSAQCTYHNA